MDAYAINVIARSPVDAQTLSPRLAALPEVSRVVTLLSFVPKQQEEKLDLIAGAAGVLEDAINDVSLRKPPSDEELKKRRPPGGPTAEPPRSAQYSTRQPARHTHVEARGLSRLCPTPPRSA
jgi:hypothetical protein